LCVAQFDLDDAKILNFFYLSYSYDDYDDGSGENLWWWGEAMASKICFIAIQVFKLLIKNIFVLSRDSLFSGLLTFLRKSSTKLCNCTQMVIFNVARLLQILPNKFFTSQKN
jgi:hypothetical protein